MFAVVTSDYLCPLYKYSKINPVFYSRSRLFWAPGAGAEAAFSKLKDLHSRRRSFYKKK